MAMLIENGSRVKLARWAKRTQNASGGTETEYFAEDPGDGAVQIDQSANEWADGAYIPSGYTAEEIVAMGEREYRKLPTESEDTVKRIVDAMERGLWM